MNLNRRIQKLEFKELPKIVFCVVETEADADALLAHEALHNIVPPPGRVIIIDGVPDSMHLGGSLD